MASCACDLTRQNCLVPLDYEYLFYNFELEIKTNSKKLTNSYQENEFGAHSFDIGRRLALIATADDFLGDFPSTFSSSISMTSLSSSSSASNLITLATLWVTFGGLASTGDLHLEQSDSKSV